MCLDTITARPIQAHDNVAGWKIFSVEKGRLVFFYACQSVRIGRVMYASKGTLGYGKKQYPNGFHFYLHYADAIRERGYDSRGVVLPVLMSGVHTYGKQNRARVGVARKMLVEG